MIKAITLMEALPKDSRINDIERLPQVRQPLLCRDHAGLSDPFYVNRSRAEPFIAVPGQV